MKDLFCCRASFQRAFGTLVVLSHLADLVTIFGVRKKKRKRQNWGLGPTDNGSLPHFVLNRVCVLLLHLSLPILCTPGLPTVLAY